MGIGLQNSSYKKIFFVFAFLFVLALQEGYGQSALSSGDLTVVTVNADGDKNFDFVPLVDIEKGTEIKFTDAAYIESEGTLDDGEGTITFTAPNGISRGDVVSYNGQDDNQTNGFERSGSFNPAASGDNIIVYQVVDSDTTYLFGIGWARGDSWNYAGGSNSSDIPAGLSKEDNQIVDLGTTDNYQYEENNGIEGTANSLLELVGNESNWGSDNENAFSAFNSSFTLVDPPTIAFSSSKIPGEEDSIAELEVELVEADGSDVDVEVAFLPGSSTAENGDDFDSYSTQTVNFSDTDDSGTTKTVSIDFIDDKEFEGSEKAVFQLQNISTGELLEPKEKTITIEDINSPDIVINEIHADPADGIDGDADGNEERDVNDDEFVELVNNSSSDIDISDWVFYNENDPKHTFPDGTVIPANGALVLFGDDDVSPQGSFGGAIVQSTNESATLGLVNGGDTIRLEDADGNEVVSVDYPSANNGQSLVRDPEITGDFEEHSNVDEAGGSLFSPGTKADGSAFGSKFATGIRGNQGWRMISSPVQSASFDDFFGDFWMQGVSESDDPSGDLTLASWSESNTTFTVPSSMSDNMTPGKGYIVYVFEDDEFNNPGIQGGFPKVINTDGDDNGSSVSVPVTATDADGENGVDGNEGWNLLGNPFGTDLSVGALLTALEDFDSSANANIYVWDHTANNGNGDYITLEDGDRIAPFQAFFVRFDSEVDGDVSFDKSDLEANTGTEFYKDNDSEAFAFDLQLHGEQYYDTYSLKFSENGTVDLDRYDAYKLFSLNANSINLYSAHGNNRLQKNELPRELESALEIPLSFDANGRTDLTFRWDNLDDIPGDWDVTLIDTQEDREINLLTSQEYQFTVSSENEQNTSKKQTLLNKRSGEEEESRFVLAINPNNEEMASGEIPESVKLNPNYPNPFNPTTTIPYELAEDTEVKLTVWNMIGQKVATLVDGQVEAGSHEETWNASNMPSGIYIARFEVGGEVFTRKMTLIK